MDFYFVRHGETDWNVQKKIQGKTDIPLNENGRSQARALAKRLAAKHLEVGCVYTSPQVRASETAQLVAHALGIPCEVRMGLSEMNMGDWEGLNWDYIREMDGERYRKWKENRRYARTPGGESYNEVLERTLEALDQIGREGIRDVMVVSHSAVLMALRCFIAGYPFGEMRKHFRTRNAELVKISGEDVRKAIVQFAAEKE